MEKVIQDSIKGNVPFDPIGLAREGDDLLFDIAPVPMWVYDKLTHSLLLVNQSALLNYGYSRKEFLSLNLKQLIHKDDHGRLKDVLSLGFNITGEWMISTRHDKTVIANILTRDYVVNGKKAVLVVAHDITETKAIQASLHEQKELLQKVLYTIPHAVFWKDKNSRFLGCNHNFLQNAGLSAPEEVVGKTDYDMPWTKEESDYYVQCDRQVIESEIPMVNHEEKHTDADGTETTVLTSKVPIRNDRGEIIGLLGLFIDITERKKIEEKLLIQQQAIEAVGVGITIANPNKQGNPIIFANPEFLSISGYSEREIIGKPVDFLRGQDTDPETIAQIQKAYVNCQPFFGEILNYRKNGEPFWSSITINPIFDSKGKLINFVEFQQDITEKKNAEIQISNKTQELNTFMYRASHDLRGPLASLMGLTNLAQREFNQENSGVYLQMISETSSRLDEILKNLMDLTYLKQVDINIEPVNFESLIEAIFTKLSYKFDKDKIDIVHSYDSGDVITTDKTIVRQILYHLLDNAIKYHFDDAKTPRVEISLKIQDDFYRITIADNGIGISSEVQERVFSMFFRGTELSKGCGLGLYSVKSFLEKLEGFVEIKSKEHKGTEVIVLIPKPKDL